MNANNKHQREEGAAAQPQFPSLKPVANILAELERIEAERANLLRTRTQCEAEEQAVLNSDAEIGEGQVNQISVARMKLEMIPRRLERLDAREAELREKALTATREVAKELNELARQFEEGQISKIEKAIKPWLPEGPESNHKAREIWRLSIPNNALRSKAGLLFCMPYSIDDGITTARSLEDCIHSAREIMTATL